MKKFTKNVNEKVKPYDGNKKLHKIIYDLIDKYIIAKIDGEERNDINVVGKEKLTEELILYIGKEIDKSKIYFLERLREEPNFYETFSEMRKGFRNILKSMMDVKDKNDIDKIKEEIEKFNEKWNNIFNDDVFVITVNKLKDNLKNKEEKIKNNKDKK